MAQYYKHSIIIIKLSAKLTEKMGYCYRKALCLNFTPRSIEIPIHTNTIVPKCKITNFLKEITV